MAALAEDVEMPDVAGRPDMGYGPHTLTVGGETYTDDEGTELIETLPDGIAKNYALLCHDAYFAGIRHTQNRFKHSKIVVL